MAFPGAFRLGGRRLVFEVPWTSLGDMARGEARVFTDWFRTGRPVNEAGSDVAPDADRAPFTR